MSATSITQLYQERLKTAEEAAGLIPSGAKVAMGLAAGQPPAILAALAARARAGGVKDVGLYYMLAVGNAATTVLAEDLNDILIPHSLFHGGVERGLDKARAAKGLSSIDFLPSHFSQIPRLLVEHVGVDTLVTTVSSMDADGYFSLGTSCDYAHMVSRSGAKMILEVNPQMPYVHGDCKVHVSDVTALVEHDAAITLLPQAKRTDVDDKIGAIVAAMVDDGACLQMGIGALPDAVCAGLANHKYLGVHTEMMTSGLAQLMKAGIVDNSRKTIRPGAAVYAFALGDQELYDFINDNPQVEAHPVNYVNDPFVISQNDKVISVNATLQVDFSGACNSEFVNGRQFSATGGQLDFVRGAYRSKGGKSIIACHSTAAKGTISRIVPTLDGPVTTPRTETQIIVTEYGWTDLKGKGIAERAQALIGIAHPDFREELERQAFDLGILPKKF